MTNWLGSLLSEDVLPSDHPILILIVCGGLGGLTTALALARHGQRVRVLEGAPAFGAIGYGIQFGPNVLHRIDLHTSCSTLVALPHLEQNCETGIECRQSPKCEELVLHFG